MQRSRRVFLGAAMAATATAALEAQQPHQGSQPPFIPNNRSPFPNQPSEVPDIPKPDVRTLKANQETIKKDIARLNELVQQLQKGIESSDMTDVLSLDVLKKCDEIEKLAKQVHNLVRG